ncbi:MAG: DinB family protein [Acidimicrobiales bacterium]
MPAVTRPVTDERDGLTAFLNQQRSVLRMAAYGLTDEQARLAPTVSSLSVGGLIRHAAAMERNWMDMVCQRRRQGSPDAYQEAFQLGKDQTLGAVLDDYAAATAGTDATVAGIDDLGRVVPVPKGVPWFATDVEAWSVRWVMLHMIQETARHAGHADIIREAIDGATAFPLMAAAEGWPETLWMKPWRPVATA